MDRQPWLEGIAEKRDCSFRTDQNGVIVLDWRPSVRWLLEKNAGE